MGKVLDFRQKNYDIFLNLWKFKPCVHRNSFELAGKT